LKNCSNCKKDFKGNYCHYCGAPSEIKRIDSNYIVNEIRSIINFEKGFLFTIKELIIRPEFRIKQFIKTDRNKIVKPILFLIICSIIYSIFNSSKLPRIEKKDESILELLANLLTENPGYANIILVFFTAVWIFVFFRKHKYNYYEILILLFFIAGIQVLINSIFEALEFFWEIEVPFNRLIAYLYSGWVVGRFFNKRKVASYFLGYLAQILGAVCMLLSLIGIGELLDLIKNNYS